MKRHISKFISLVHSLRIFFLSFIVVSFLFLLGLNPIDISVFYGAKLGQAVGMNIGVPENPYNKLALQLKDKEDKLNQREEILGEREQLITETYFERQERLLVLIAIGIAVLLILILINFYYDYKRRLAIVK